MNGRSRSRDLGPSRVSAWVPASLLLFTLVAACSVDPSSDEPDLSSGTTSRPAVSTSTPTTGAAIVTSTDQVGPSTSLPPADVLFSGPTAGPSGDPGSLLMPGAEEVAVSSITDGDTIEVIHSDGTPAVVRLIGINTPESNECFSTEATRVLEALTPVGSEIGMTSDVSNEDQFGRLLRYLWVGEMSVNEEIVRRGAAISRRYAPDTALATRFEAAQADAKAAGLGLWASEACGPRADASLGIANLEYDPPGNDNDILNEEWVQIRNDGDNLVDLTGWVVKDESASNRFEFPTSFTLAAGESVTIYSGCGDDFGAFLYWCSVGSAIWNNDGDTVFLIDPYGNVHVSEAYVGATSSPAAPPTSVLGFTGGGGACDASYPDVCIAVYPPDLDCGEIPHRRFAVVGDDPHGFDRDRDGVGCES